ncbi:TetR/AcrR family transcriptional regulator [Salimicrobium halophilum]|uniref:DNA-binding transcriptional regulator, AcrR family n=1 Tax=Salimicrobium halophilum TaxID=86666 RepID=A0A1G8U9W2_9BACI|nr:TetR/AcrR family transcriptional regulator [Salimicrobium halophilum]SDJ50543.1 DNA-binding transcriptional regulator, AcrR family [Salimicrobium halophilum]
MARHSRKIEILDAASRIVSQQGIFNLTLEAVAKEAGISKGGLLYHFKTKEALVSGMVKHLTDNYREKIEAHVEADPEEIGRWTRAFLNVTFNHVYPNKDWNAGLLAAKAVNPALLKPLHDAYKDWQHKIENDGLDPTDATLIRLSTDGIWLSELFDVYQIEEEKKEQVYKRLSEWLHALQKKEVPFSE